MTRVIDTGVTGGAPNLVGSLAASARLLPENIDWQPYGVSYVPENCGNAWPWQQCTVAGSGEGEQPKPLNDGVAAVEFKPFLVEYNAASCGGIPGDWEKLSDRAKRGLTSRYSNVIAHTLSSTAPDGELNDSPNLPTVADDITAAGAGEIVCTLSGLIQDAYACGATGELFIHAPAWLLPLLLNRTLVTQVGNVLKLGPHTVVLDQGYSNEAPVGSPVAAAGEVYVYVSGPVEYATGSLRVLDDTTKGVSPRLNRANAIAAQLAIYRFDPCCVKAALVQVC